MGIYELIEIISLSMQKEEKDNIGPHLALTFGGTTFKRVGIPLPLKVVESYVHLV
jgi:hypothetical protein